MRLIDADELITAFPCGESVRTESVRATINHMPTIEVSEDCISREWVLREFETGRENISKSEYFDELIWLVIHAPSVVPTARENRTTAEPQTYITEDRDAQILDAWQVHHRNTTTVEGEPTTEQSSIVHCKDCKHWNDFYSKCTKWTVDTYEQAQTNAEDFCSYGEREDNE